MTYCNERKGRQITVRKGKQITVRKGRQFTVREGRKSREGRQITAWKSEANHSLEGGGKSQLRVRTEAMYSQHSIGIIS